MASSGEQDASFSKGMAAGIVAALAGLTGSAGCELILDATEAAVLTPTTGQILIDNKAPGPVTKAIISYLPERTYLDRRTTIKKTLDFFQDFYKDFNKKTAQKLLKDLDLDEDQKISAMSKGMQEKLQLILVMSRKAKLYILDEPLGGVDPATRDYILDTILKNFNPNASLIISTHLISDIERILDEVIFIDKGQIVLQSDADALRAKYKTSIDAIFRKEMKC